MLTFRFGTTLSQMTDPAIEKSSQKQPTPKFTFELLQILRGLAALIVIGYHCHSAGDEYFRTFPFRRIFAFGLFGVDFFFVLSGFIITYIHLDDLKRRTSLASFIRKRFFRIYPIYWVVAVLTFVYIVLFAQGHIDHDSRILHWNDSGDWLYVIRCFLLLPQNAMPMVDVSWTLNYELLFYFVFAICILLGWKFARIVWVAWVALILAHNLGFWNTDQYFLNFIFSPLIVEFLMGCLLAFLFVRQKIRLTIPLFVLLISMLGIFAVIYLRIFDHQFGREQWNYVLIIGGAILAVWTAASVDKSRKLAGTRWGLLMLLGNASYSIYLIHTLVIRIIFTAARNVLGEATFQNNTSHVNLLSILSASVAIFIGILLHLRVEKPLLKYTNRTFLPERQTA